MRLLKVFCSNVSKMGRWEHRMPDNQKDLKAIWASADHCGETICKDPLLVKDVIKQQQLACNFDHTSDVVEKQKGMILKN